MCGISGSTTVAQSGENLLMCKDTWFHHRSGRSWRGNGSHSVLPGNSTDKEPKWATVHKLTKLDSN